jgi:hypothetical protein
MSGRDESDEDAEEDPETHESSGRLHGVRGKRERSGGPTRRAKRQKVLFLDYLVV